MTVRSVRATIDLSYLAEGSSMYSSHVKYFDDYIASLLGSEDEEGPVRKDTYGVHTYKIRLPDTVGTCYGSASFVEDSDQYGLYHFDISLGPANAQRLVEFLRTLPDEPDAD